MNRGKDKIEYAIYYATRAHKNQKRKIEDVDMIFHPFTVVIKLVIWKIYLIV